MRESELSARSLGAAFGSTAGFMIGVSSVVNPSFGVFMGPLTRAFHWSRTEISASHLFYSWTMALLFPLTGRLMDRFGVRAVVLPGIIVFGLILLGLSVQNGSIYLFYALFVLLGMCAATGGQVPYSKVVSGWFHRRRGLVLAVIGFGATIAAAFIPQASKLLLQQFGWRGAYVGLAAYVLLVGLPLVFLLLREAPAVAAARQAARQGGMTVTVRRDASQVLGLSAAEARRSRPFLLCVVAVALAMIINSGVIAHVVALLTDRGVPMGTAVTFLTFTALGGAVCRVLEGFLLDRIDSPKLGLPFIGLALAGILMLEFGSGQAVYMTSGALIGAGIAGETAIIPYLFTRYFGLRAFAEVYGSLWACAAVASGVGPIIMGRVYDTTGSYYLALSAAAVALAIAAMCFWLLPPYRYPADMDASGAPAA